MNPIPRNPDIRHDSDADPYTVPPEKIPPGCYLVFGKQLMLSARKCKPPVPYGIVQRRVPCSNSSRIETVGLVIRLADKKRFAHALACKRTSKVYQPASQ